MPTEIKQTIDLAEAGLDFVPTVAELSVETDDQGQILAKKVTLTTARAEDGTRKEVGIDVSTL